MIGGKEGALTIPKSESWEVEVLEDNTALLTWETESETNVAGFTIEQKIEGTEDSSFNLIGVC